MSSFLKEEFLHPNYQCFLAFSWVSFGVYNNMNNRNKNNKIYSHLLKQHPSWIFSFICEANWSEYYENIYCDTLGMLVDFNFKHKCIYCMHKLISYKSYFFFNFNWYLLLWKKDFSMLFFLKMGIRFLCYQTFNI